MRSMEFRRAALLGHVLKHVAEAAVADFPENLAAELEVVALLIDRERAVALDVDAALDRADDLVEADVLLARKQRNVRHALELHIGPVLRTSSRASDGCR